MTDFVTSSVVIITIIIKIMIVISASFKIMDTPSINYPNYVTFVQRL